MLGLLWDLRDGQFLAPAVAGSLQPSTATPNLQTPVTWFYIGPKPTGPIYLKVPHGLKWDQILSGY